MRTVRKTVVILAVMAGVLALAAPAFAHEEINPKQFPTGTPTFFTLSTDPVDPGDTITLPLVFLNSPKRIRLTVQLLAGPGLVKPLAAATAVKPTSPLILWRL